MYLSGSAQLVAYMSVRFMNLPLATAIGLNLHAQEVWSEIGALICLLHGTSG
jgi:hypothetical protein